MRRLCSILTILTIVVATPAASAQEAQVTGEPPSKPFMVAGALGVSIPYTKLKTTFMFDVEAGYRFPFYGERMGVSLSFAYTRPTSEGTVRYASGIAASGETTTAEVDYDTVLDEMILGINIFYRIFDDSSWWNPWVSIGPGFFFLKHAVNAFGVTNTQTKTTYGFIASVGCDFRLGPGYITAVFRFPWAPIDNKTLGDADVGMATIQAGYRFMF